MNADDRTFWRRDRVAGLALILFAAAIVWEARRLPLGTWHNPGAGYLPLLLAGLIALFGALVALGGAHSPRLRALGWAEAPQALTIVVACAASAYLLERIGYRLTIFALIGFFLIVVERRRIVISVPVAAALAIGSYHLFATWLRVPLPLGPWGL